MSIYMINEEKSRWKQFDLVINDSDQEFDSVFLSHENPSFLIEKT